MVFCSKITAYLLKLHAYKTFSLSYISICLSYMFLIRFIFGILSLDYVIGVTYNGVKRTCFQWELILVYNLEVLQ